MATRFILSILLGFSWYAASAQIGAKAHQQNTITGIWSSNQFGFEMILMLNPDNTGEFDGEALSYTVNGNSLVLKSEGSSTTYQFDQQGDQLTLSGGDLDSKVTFTRKGQNKDTTTHQTNAANQTDVSNETPSIIGTWSGGGEVVEFRNDGQCVISGQSVSYQYTPPWIELNGASGSVKIEASFNDNDHMNLKVNGSMVSYTRNGGTKSTTNTGQINNNSGTARKQLDMTIVGKWCYTDINSYNQGSSYSSTCITLNADGTYVYVTESERSVNTADMSGGTVGQGNDAGKWWVEGDHIFYDSPTKGQGSFRLEKRNHPKNVNDPMIVIEGTPYVTAYYKAPW